MGNLYEVNMFYYLTHGSKPWANEYQTTTWFFCKWTDEDLSYKSLGRYLLAYNQLVGILLN